MLVVGVAGNSCCMRFSVVTRTGIISLLKTWGADAMFYQDYRLFIVNINLLKISYPGLL